MRLPFNFRVRYLDIFTCLMITDFFLNSTFSKADTNFFRVLSGRLGQSGMRDGEIDRSKVRQLEGYFKPFLARDVSMWRNLPLKHKVCEKRALDEYCLLFVFCKYWWDEAIFASGRFVLLAGIVPGR